MAGLQHPEMTKLKILSKYVGLLFLGLVFVCPNEACHNIVVDLVSNYVSNGVHCLVLAGENWINDEFWKEINNSSLSLTFIESNVNSSYMKRRQRRMEGLHPSRDCSSYLMILDNVNSTLHFLNREGLTNFQSLDLHRSIYMSTVRNSEIRIFFLFFSISLANVA